MSSLFGQPTQLGIVVPDLGAALDYWTRTIGAGPFFVIDDLEHTTFTIGDEPAPLPGMRIALGNWGDLQIELIEPVGESRATWHTYLAERGGGAHHTSVWTEDYDAMIAATRARGLATEASGRLASGVRYTYFRAPSPSDPLIEVSELLPVAAEAYALLRQLAQDWDGADPVRGFDRP